MATLNLNTVPSADQNSQRRPENQMFPHDDLNRPQNVSVDFVVEDLPVQIRAFNLHPLDKISIEMKGIVGCHEVYAPYWYCNCPEELKHPKTVHFIEVPGTYRLILTGQNLEPHIKDILVTKTFASQRERAHKPTAGCGNC
jgi:hypothetical protein